MVPEHGVHAQALNFVLEHEIFLHERKNKFSFPFEHHILPFSVEFSAQDIKSEESENKTFLE